MRRNLLILLCAVSVVLYSSCNGSFGTIVPDFGEYNGISVKNIRVNAAHNFTSGSLPAFKKLIREYNNTNTFGINVELIEEGLADQKADIVFNTPSEAAALLRHGKSIELSPLAAHPKWGLDSGRSIFYPAARRQTDYFDFARKITSIPILMNAGVMVVNNDLLKSAGINKFPSTWFGFNRLLRKAGRPGTPVLGMQLDADSVVSFIISRGGSILMPAGFAFSIDNPVVNRTIRYIRNLEQKDILSVESTRYLNQTIFSFGKLAAAFIQIDGIPHYGELAAMTNPDLDWSVELLPTRKPGKGAVINCSYSASIIEGEAEKELSSWMFIKWLTETEQQQTLAEMTSSIPTVKKAADAILENPGKSLQPQWINALELINSSHMEVIPSLSNYTSAAASFEQMLSRIRSGDWIWLETLKLNRQIKKQRRKEYTDRMGRK